MKLQTPKGFRDFLPQDAFKRQIVMQKIIKIFEKFGFDPLETPTLEYADTLKGKYGEEERLIYEFTTKGGDQVALKYDQTVPLARVIAQYPNLPKPFKRYQIQDAYRGENTQKGRYRQFLQCDGDIVGASTPLADAEILGICYEIYRNLGLDIVIKINDRSIFVDIKPTYLSSLDKLEKIGEEAVLQELTQKGLGYKEAQDLFNKLKDISPTKNLVDIVNLFEKLGYPKGDLKFDPYLARGLDYYTGLIFEVVLKDKPTTSSLCGGGRWDNMIGKFTNITYPAVGFAIGVDRTIEAMEEASLLDIPSTNTKVLVSVFSKELLTKSLEITSILRSKSINTEIYLDTETKLDKQLKYADQKQIPFAVIIGPDESKNNKITLKDLRSKSQETTNLEDAIMKITDEKTSFV